MSTERGTNIVTEFRGGLATFLTMAYILAINPSLLSNLGGICNANDFGGPFSPGMDECVERLAVPAAIGAFLAHLGLQTAEGIGVVVGDIVSLRFFGKHYR